LPSMQAWSKPMPIGRRGSRARRLFHRKSQAAQSKNEDGIFIVDDVAFIQERHAFAIGEAIARKNIRKNYYLETRGDVLLKNKEVFKFWKELGVNPNLSRHRGD